MNTTYYIESISCTLAEGLDEGDLIINLGVIYKDYLHYKHVKGVEMISEYSHHNRMMDSIDRIFEYFAWQPCGLNGDWCVQAYHYGFNSPNIWDGEYYVTDQEDGTFDVVRYYPNRDEDCVESIQQGFNSLEGAKAFTRSQVGTEYFTK
jgi:hypothetical protein